MCRLQYLTRMFSLPLLPLPPFSLQLLEGSSTLFRSSRLSTTRSRRPFFVRWMWSPSLYPLPSRQLSPLALSMLSTGYASRRYTASVLRGELIEGVYVEDFELAWLLLWLEILLAGIRLGSWITNCHCKPANNIMDLCESAFCWD